MPLTYYPAPLSRRTLHSRPANLFVIEDNTRRRGWYDRSLQLRRQPNIVGLTVARSCYKAGGSYFDKDLPEIKNENFIAVHTLKEHLKNGGTVEWPFEGIGRERLAHAPILYQYYLDLAVELASIHPEIF